MRAGATSSLIPESSLDVDVLLASQPISHAVHVAWDVKRGHFADSVGLKTECEFCCTNVLMDELPASFPCTLVRRLSRF